MQVIKSMLSVKKFTDFGTLYWLILAKGILAILAVICSN